MELEILPFAEDDLVAGHRFYERQAPGLGDYFLDALYADIDSLALYAGIHRKVDGLHRALSNRFPYAIYYALTDGTVVVWAVFDCRRNPSALGKSLRSRARRK